MSPETYTVERLCAEVQALVAEAWGSVWVAGEVQRPRTSRPGHVYLELVEKGDGDQVVGKLDAVVWRSHAARIHQTLQRSGLELAEGVQIRCHGRLDFWPPGGRLQLVVDQIDPVFTEGQLERQRRETLEALAASGLLERNKRSRMPMAPLAVGLVTSEGTAAYHDFLSTLSASGYAFQVLFVHAAVQGKGAEREIVGALELLERRAIAGHGSRMELDCVAIVRGGGSRTDLAVFDNRAVAEAVARFPLPVITGLGHEIDFSVADRVAHTHEKTPTAVAEALVRRVTQAEAAVVGYVSGIARRAEQRMAAARGTVHVIERDVRAVRSRLHHAWRRLVGLAGSLDRAGRARLRTAHGRRRDLARRVGARSAAALERGRQRPRYLVDGVHRATRARLAAARARVTGWRELIDRLSPERTLARGFSITRAGDGRALRDATTVSPGTRLETELFRGTLASRVEET